jgi:hypothetical protein
MEKSLEGEKGTLTVQRGCRCSCHARGRVQKLSEEVTRELNFEE